MFIRVFFSEPIRIEGHKAYSVSAQLSFKGKKARGGTAGQSSVVLGDGLSFTFSAIADYKSSSHSSSEVGQIPTLLYFLPDDFKTDNQVLSLFFLALQEIRSEVKFV
jgi:PHR domain